LIGAAALIVAKYQRLHGDRTVALALLNPELKEKWPEAPLPNDVWNMIEPLEPAQLWTAFKDAGGTTKELQPFEDESMQYDALKKLWTSLISNNSKAIRDNRNTSPVISGN